MCTHLDIDNLIADLRAAVAGPAPQQSAREVLQRAVSEPGSMMRTLGEPDRAEIGPLYHGPDLTVLKVVLAPNMVFPPHDHRMWAAVGIYTGREDNIFWRRVEDNRIEASGARSIGGGEVLPLGPDIVHSVCNPVSRLTAAIHVYGGDFFAAERSEWDPEDLRRRPYDVDKNFALFERANAMLEAV